MTITGGSGIDISPEFSDDSEIEVRALYAPAGDFGLEISSLEVVPAPKHKSYYYVQSMIEPLPNSSKNFKTSWENIGQKTDVFDEKVHNEKDWLKARLVLPDTKSNPKLKRVSYVSCIWPTDKPKDQLLEVCQKLRENTKAEFE